MHLNFRRVLKFCALIMTLSFAQAFSFAHAQGQETQSSRTTAPGLVSATIVTEAEVSHLEVVRPLNWNYKFQKTSPDEFRLTIPHLDVKSKNEFNNFKSEHLLSVRVEPAELADQSTVIFKVKSPLVDGFDYLTDDPGRLIIDFYIEEPKVATASKSGTETADAKAETKAETKAIIKSATAERTKVNAAENTDTGSSSRLPASSELLKIEPKNSVSNETIIVSEQAPELSRVGLFDGGDPDFKRFMIQDYEVSLKAIVASRQNLYLPFPIIEFENKQLKQVEEVKPKYVIEPKENLENQEARLVLKLFENKRIASFLTASEIFLKKFPQSKYREMIKYLNADTIYDSYKGDRQPANFDRAVSAYKNLILEFPNSVLAKRSRLLVNYALIDRGNYMAALRSAEEFARSEPEAAERFEVQLGQAHSLNRLHKYDDALAALDKIESSDASEKVRAEAALMKGNSWFKQKNYEAAVKAYQVAYEKFPKARTQTGLGLYNAGEALFWLGKRKEALEVLREYLQRFPDAEYGGYALTRIGEILESLGAPPERSLGALKECMFRFPGSGGAKVAEIKILTRRMKDMRQKELDHTVSHIKDLKEKVSIPEVGGYVNFLLSGGMFDRGDFKKSTQMLIDYYQAHPKVATRQFFSENIAKGITAEIAKQNRENEDFSAVKTYNKFASSWLKNNERLDTLFHTAHSFEKIGASHRALAFYKKVEGGLKESEKNKALKESRLIEDLPSMDELKVRMATVHEHLNQHDQAAKLIDSIQNRKALTPILQIEESLLGAKLEEIKGNDLRAVKRCLELEKMWDDQKELLSPVYLQSARLLAKVKNFSTAEEQYLKIINGNFDKKVTSQAYNELSKVYENSKRPDKAIGLLPVYIEKFEANEDLSEARYRLGSLQFEKKNYEDAKKTWDPLIEKNNVWAKLAKDRLKEADWNKEYDKYVDRIPAMDGIKKQGASKND